MHMFVYTIYCKYRNYCKKIIVINKRRVKISPFVYFVCIIISFKYDLNSTDVFSYENKYYFFIKRMENKLHILTDIKRRSVSRNLHLIILKISRKLMGNKS